MSIKRSDLRFYASDVTPDDDSVLEIGGAIDRTKMFEFTDVGGAVQLVSSDVDDVEDVELFYRDAAGTPLSEIKALTGQTPVVYTPTPERLLKAIKAGTTEGDVAIEAQSATRSNTAAAGDVDWIQLDAGASATENFYAFQVIRLTGGTGAGQIRQIIYHGTDRKSYPDRPFSPAPDGTTTFRIAPGFYFPKLPVEVLEVRRPFYAAAADNPGGSTRVFHEKLFAENSHATLTLLNALLKETSDPSTFVTFALETTKDGTGTNGAGNNRQVAPSTGVGSFSSADKAVVDGELLAGETQGLWLALTLAAGATSLKTTYGWALDGASI